MTHDPEPGHWLACDRRNDDLALRPATRDVRHEVHDLFGRSALWVKVGVVHAKAPPAGAADSQRRRGDSGQLGPRQSA